MTQSETDTNTDTELNKSAEDNFLQPQLKSKTPAKKRKLSHLTNMLSQLKDITDTANANSATDEHEFGVFGKHVSMQL